MSSHEIFNRPLTLRFQSKKAHDLITNPCVKNKQPPKVQREIDLGMKERQLEQLAEDYRLEINELKAKLTNMAYQAKHLKV